MYTVVENGEWEPFDNEAEVPGVFHELCAHAGHDRHEHVPASLWYAVGVGVAAPRPIEDHHNHAVHLMGGGHAMC
jgi:hypothetical protein